MADSGMMASLLNWDIEQVRFDPDRLGKLVETFIFNELQTQIDTNEDGYALTHYRDRENREIDFIIEGKNQKILGVEVKASTTVGKDDFKHLRWFQQNLAKNREFTGIVLYAGERPLSFGKNLWAIPMGMLWPISSGTISPQ